MPFNVHGRLETPYVPAVLLPPWLTGAITQVFVSFFGIGPLNYLSLTIKAVGPVRAGIAEAAKQVGSGARLVVRECPAHAVDRSVTRSCRRLINPFGSDSTLSRSTFRFSSA